MSDNSAMALLRFTFCGKRYSRRRRFNGFEQHLINSHQKAYDEDPADLLSELLNVWFDSFCKRCGADGHMTEDCDSPAPRCRECGNLHDVGKPCFENGAVR